MTREDIIVSMCYTMRHDFGLVIDPDVHIGSGMTAEEQAALYKQMEQIYDNCIAPYMTLK
jgi:hypothetical protein